MSRPRKLKVVHLVTRLDFGGAQQNTLYTASHLDPERFDVVLATGEGGLLDAQARAQAEDPRRPFRVRFIPDLVREVHPARDVMALLQLFQFLRDESPDIVHTHSSKAGILGRLAAWMAGVPGIVHTYHGFGFHDRQSAIVHQTYVALERACCRISSRIIYVSEDNRRYARNYGLTAPEQEVLIRSGVQLDRYPAPLEDKAKKKASLGCRMHQPMVVSIGNLKLQKNPMGFLRVAELCLQEVPESNWVFIGDGEMRTQVEAQVVARGLHGKVFFPGWRRDTAEILAAADVFVLTSLWEGLPRALVEAMKSRLPCVCYATDGVRDVIQNGGNGFLVTRGNESGMANSIVALLKNPEIAQTAGEKAAKSIGKEFDIDEMVRRQEQLYSELASNPRHA